MTAFAESGEKMGTWREGFSIGGEDTSKNLIFEDSTCSQVTDITKVVHLVPLELDFFAECCPTRTRTIEALRKKGG